MGKILLVCGFVLGIIFSPVISAVTLLVVIATPAVDQELRTIDCFTAAPATGQWRPPFAQAYTQTSTFGMRFHPIHQVTKLHAGVDLTAKPTAGEVVTPSSGTVTNVYWSDSGGNIVEIDHGDQVKSRFLHLSRTTVSKGDAILAGEPIGVEGTTGNSTGIHLHFEIHVNGEAVDPGVFMAERGATLNGDPVAAVPVDPADLPDDVAEGGVGFDLPLPGVPVKASLNNPAQPIPTHIEDLYKAAAAEYNLPWTLLAGVGMEETNHDRLTATSTAGAQGAMQFTPATFAQVGVDGDGDGRKDINNTADSIYSAANYLVTSGATKGPQGVRDALFAYNHADWYVNDVLTYAENYGGGIVLADPTDCGPGDGIGNPDLPPISDERVVTMLSFAASQEGKPYVLGANGPNQWDCSSLTRAALAKVGVTAPRTAAAQRDWLALGNGYQVSQDEAKPGDLVFYDSYLGPFTVGHVAMIWDPATKTTIEAFNADNGVGYFSYEGVMDNNIFEIWRVGSVSDQPTAAK